MTLSSGPLSASGSGTDDALRGPYSFRQPGPQRAMRARDFPPADFAGSDGRGATARSFLQAGHVTNGRDPHRQFRSLTPQPTRGLAVRVDERLAGRCADCRVEVEAGHRRQLHEALAGRVALRRVTIKKREHPHAAVELVRREVNINAAVVEEHEFSVDPETDPIDSKLLLAI